MRLLTLTVALFVLAPATAYPPPPKSAPVSGPAVTLQSAPLGQLLDDARAFIKHVAGPFADQAIQSFDSELDSSFGKLDGFDLKKPLAGYVILKDKPEEIGLVAAFPYTDEAKFVATVSRKKPKATPVAGNKGLYKYDSEEDPAPFPIRLRFHEGYVYVSLNLADQALDVGSLISVDKLIDSKETAQFAAKGAVDKIPVALLQTFQQVLAGALGTMKKNAEASGPNTVKATDAFAQLLRRQVAAVTQDGETLGLKLRLDVKAGTLALDAIVAGRPGSGLATNIAAIKPATNRFSGLVDKDVAAAGFFKPFFAPEIRDATAAGFDELEKMGKDQMPAVAQPFLKELFAGLNRTVKSPEVDAAGVLFGPDAKGLFTGVVAVSFADATKIEPELKKFVKVLSFGAKDEKDLVQWDVAKAGEVSLHEMTIPDLPAEAKKVFGDKPIVCFGFGKNAVYAGIGPDARAKVSAAVTVKPPTGPTPMFDLSFNPSRLVKLAKAIDERAAGQMEQILGNADAKTTVMSLNVAGGSQLTVTWTLNLAMFQGMRAGTARR